MAWRPSGKKGRRSRLATGVLGGGNSGIMACGSRSGLDVVKI